MATTKITLSLERRIQELRSSGKTTRQIAAALTKEGCRISHVAIGDYIRRVKTERGKTSKALAQGKLATHVTSDLDRIEDVLASLIADEERQRAEIDSGKLAGSALATARMVRLRTVDRIKTLSDLKLHYSGADAPDAQGPHDEEAAARVVAKLQAMFEEIGAAPHFTAGAGANPTKESDT